MQRAHLGEPRALARLEEAVELHRLGRHARGRTFDCRLKIVLPVVMELTAGQGQSSAGLFCYLFLIGIT